MPKRVPRKPRPKKVNVPKGYDSHWEYDIHKDLLGDWKHHHDVIDYTIPHKYEPDFVKVIDGMTILLEAKAGFGIMLSIVSMFTLEIIYQMILWS